METFDGALGLLETTGYTPALVALDAMQKAADIEVIQAELNDFLGVCIKLKGSVAQVSAAIKAGRAVADRLGGRPIVDVINCTAREAEHAIFSAAEFNPLIQQDVVHFPSTDSTSSTQQTTSQRATSGEATVADSTSFALGFIETQGFTAVFEAIDTACKAANVEVVGKEKLGGGYVTVIIKGDVAAVNAAVEAGRHRVADLGKLIAAHVIARPSPAMLSLLPK